MNRTWFDACKLKYISRKLFFFFSLPFFYQLENLCCSFGHTVYISQIPKAVFHRLNILFFLLFTHSVSATPISRPKGMPVRCPGSSSLLLGAGQWAPTWVCWAALDAEVTSLSLAHTDIYWSWAGETITCNEAALLPHVFPWSPVLWLTPVSILQPISVSCVMASCTGVLLPHQPASPHRMCHLLF